LKAFTELSPKISPATSSSSSKIDWGAEDKSLTCTVDGAPSVWMPIIKATFYVVNVIGISIHNKPIELPNGARRLDGIVDSCTTLVYLPKLVLSRITDSIINSGVLAAAGMTSNDINDFLFQHYGYALVIFILKFSYTGLILCRFQNLDYSLLPNISFSIAGFSGEIVVLTLSPYAYIQGDGSGYFYFPLAEGSDFEVTFGAAFHDSFYILIDRANLRLGFGPGCDCNT
jgi:hypothetical protein